MKLALDAWQELPEGTIHTIPVRIDDCEVPEAFRRYHWTNLFTPNGFDHIVRAIRAEITKRSGPTPPPSPQPSPRPSLPERPAAQDTALEPLRTNSWPDPGPPPEFDKVVRAVEETLESGASASMRPQLDSASPRDDKP